MQCTRSKHRDTEHVNEHKRILSHTPSITRAQVVTGPPKDDVYPRDFAHIYGVLDDRYITPPYKAKGPPSDAPMVRFERLDSYQI
jgi:hypothetical protein